MKINYKYGLLFILELGGGPILIMNIFFILLLIFSNTTNDTDYLTLKDNGQTIMVISKDEVMTSILDVPLVNSVATEQLLQTLEKDIFLEPKNATIGDDGRIVSEEVGYKLNKEAFLELYYDYLYHNRSTVIEVPKIPIYPKVDSEILSQIKVKKIGQFVTFFNSRNISRTHNITLAAEAIDNYVVFPNEVFSFNQVVGMRTEGRGYLLAPIIIRGELSEGVGGGICQVSSTLFNAVDLAGLKIVERYSHSRSVPYVRPGRDATVSWYGPDFRFQNQYNQPILIKAKRYGGSLIVMLYSSDAINLEINK